MRHVVLSEPVICPKCEKTHSGAAVAVLDFYACTNCFYEKFSKDLQPKLEKMVREYFQPERLNPKTSKGDVIV